MPKRQFVNYNGQIKDRQEPVLPVENRAFRYADGFFETIRMRNGKLLFFDRHFKRILLAFSVLGFRSLEVFNQEYLENEILHLLRVNKIMKSAVVRIAFFRQSEGRYLPKQNEWGYLIETFSQENLSYELNRKGLRIDVYEKNPKCVNELSLFKSSNSQLSVLASLFAESKRLDDILLVNVDDEIVEATASNVFFVKENILYTPSLESGCVQGVMRQVIMDLAVRLHYSVVEDAVIRKGQLTDFEEIFLTNAVNGIRWVLAYRDKRYFNNVSRRLMELLNE